MQQLHALAPAAVGSPGAYALVGMGAFFAGAARAPITAVVILFELTGEYTIILPLMLAIVLATGISHLVSHDTVYTRKLLRRGIDLDEPGEPRLRHMTVSAVMGIPPAEISTDATLESVAALFATTGEAALPATDAGGGFAGVLASADVMDALAADEDLRTLALLRHDRVSPDQPVRDALRLLDAGADAVAVTGEGDALVGWLRHRDVLARLSA